MNLQVISTIIMVVFALGVIVVRMRGGKRPVTVAKIMIPPIAMSSGFSMFFAPQMRFDWVYALVAFLVGIAFSYPLILTTQFRQVAGQIFVKRSRWFVLILLALLALRVGLHDYVSSFLSVSQTAGAFFVLAFGMILPWRVAMLFQYRKLKAAPSAHRNLETPTNALSEVVSK